jgi:leader peptidase (prepilin peptidase)/N-methyltransferase
LRIEDRARKEDRKIEPQQGLNLVARSCFSARSSILTPRSYAWFAASAAIAILLSLAPSAHAQHIHRHVWIPPEPTPFEKFVSAAVMVGVYGWIFLLGSIIGSYLNVVAYRLPKGKPLFWPPSSCPSCGSRIKIRDNVPVLGWILLNGKCRNCSQPISPRYPIVEAVVGFLFLMLAMVELFTDGANIPFRTPRTGASVVTTLLFPDPLLIATYLFHATWLSTVVAIVLIDWDASPQPVRSILSWMATIALIAVVIEPRLLPVKLASVPWAEGRLGTAVQSLVGLFGGLTIGWLRAKRTIDGSALVLAVTGAYFGWQAVLVTAIYMIVLIKLVELLTWMRIFKSRPPLSLLAGIGALVNLLFWESIAAKLRDTLS